MAQPEVVSGAPGDADPSSSSPSGGSRRRPSHGGSAAGSTPSSRLADYRRTSGLGCSDAAFRLIGNSWRSSSAKRYDTAWSSFRDFVRRQGLELPSVTLDLVLDYLAHLDSLKLAYRTIALHRSVLSSHLSTFGGFTVGLHPAVGRLMKGIFNGRPPSRRLFETWDVAAVVAVFPASPSDFLSAQRKAAFLIALASSRRPSEVASLRCDAAYMTFAPDQVRFIPSRLSKTDRQTYLGPSISISRLPASDSASCPVSALEALLRWRTSVDVSHNFVFSSPTPPHSLISVSAFSNLLRWAFRQAGVNAPPGSTRHVSVSDAFARGANLEEVLRAGDWSRAQTLFRHYLRPTSSVSQ